MVSTAAWICAVLVTSIVTAYPGVGVAQRAASAGVTLLGPASEGFDHERPGRCPGSPGDQDCFVCDHAVLPGVCHV